LSPDHFMAIDCGSGGVKCFLVNTCGKIVSQSGVEWDRDKWNIEIGWLAIKKAIRNTLSTSNIKPEQVAAVSATSMREEYVLLDEKGREITYEVTPDIYNHGDEFNKTYGKRIYLLSGHWPVPGWIAAGKMKWLRDKHPDTLARARLLLMISDWAGYMLGGTPYTEGSSACETSLFNVEKGEWAWELIDELGIPMEIFPKVMQSGIQVSQVTGKAAKGTSLLEGTPVVVGGADTQCGLLGCKAYKANSVVAVGGTTTPVQMVTDKPVFDEKKRTWTNMHTAPGKWVIESNAGRTGWIYRWFRDSILCEKASAKVYETMNAIAETTPLGSNGVQIFLGSRVFNSGPPYLEGYYLSDIPVPPTIIGSSKFTRGDLARAIIEANCYAVRANLEQLTEITGSKVKRLGFCGGNSKSNLWNEIQSAVLGKPVIVPIERDASAIGVSICAAVGSGLYSNIGEAVKSMVQMKPVRANRELVERYDGLYYSWLETRRRLSGIL
jgi:sugar (pentulose or hexulose) kinase